MNLTSAAEVATALGLFELGAQAVDERPRVFTIPAGIAFADSLARGLRARAGDDPLALAAMTVVLPTRRAVRALTDAFLRVTEGKALLLKDWTAGCIALSNTDVDEVWRLVDDGIAVDINP